jgi:hypothetical protein
VGRGLVNDKGWSCGVGVWSGEVKLGASVVTVGPVPGRVSGPGSEVDNRDKTSSNESFWLNDVSWNIVGLLHPIVA